MEDYLDLINKLELPEKGYNGLEELRSRTLGLFDSGGKDLSDLIAKLTDGIGPVSFTPQGNIELPVFYFLRAHCHYVEMEFLGNQNSDRARMDIEKAAEKFSLYNNEWNEWNESLAHCYHSLLLYRDGKFDLCHNKLTTAKQILIRLERDLTGTNHYEKLLKIKLQIDTVTEKIKRTEAGSRKVDSTGKNADQQKRAHHRSILQKHREQLQAHFDYLNKDKKRIPPTLVASLFYLYKKLNPSHSVYSEVPKPATDREKILYEELLDKIGFFEVIEQLIEMEKEFHPISSREELLEIINQEWDKDIKQ